MENPDNLIKVVSEESDEYEFESFGYVAMEVFSKRTGKELYDYIDFENFKTSEGSYPNIEFNWEEDKPESLKAICPRLYEQFWD